MGVLLLSPLLENLYGRKTRDAVRCSEVGLGGERRKEGGRWGGKEGPWVPERGGEGPKLMVEWYMCFNYTCIHIFLSSFALSLD